MIPTDEQQAALELFGSGESMVLEAGAGTGKTATLRLIAAAADTRHLRGRYMAFNKAIVTDVEGTMPRSCAASTAHSLAFRSVGKPYAHRLNSPRMASWLMAQFLDLDPIVLRLGKQTKMLSAEYLAGLTMRSIIQFSHSADEAPSVEHVPYIDGIDLPTMKGKRTYKHNKLVREAIRPAIAKAWLDLQSPSGQLPFKHDHYLKLWQLSHPRSEADYILFDEAQDANPVMAAVVEEQTHLQRVYVGDSNQAIYEFTGAVNALANIDQANRRLLTQSFRFGDAIAGAANEQLEALHSDLRLKGHPDLTSELVTFDTPDEADAILCRTNAAALRRVLEAQQRGVRPHLVGGGKEMASFARGARDLMERGRSSHLDLACFESWGEVQAYVEQDELGAELRLMVKLVDEFTVPVILTALEAMPREDAASLIVSTAHKAKGREWPAVMLDEDFAFFQKPDAPDAEGRLRYVAVTRARQRLDHSTLAGGDDRGRAGKF